MPSETPGAPETRKRKPWAKIAAVIIVLIVIIAGVLVYTIRQNRPPTISQVAVSSQAAEVGDILTYTAQAADPDGDALTYSWDFGDSGTGSGASATHAYATSGRFISLLTVTDGKGGIVTNDKNLVFVQVKLKSTDVRAPSTCPSGATANSAFTSGNTSWTYADWQDPATAASGTWSGVGGNLAGHVNITMNPVPVSTISGYFYQSFKYDGSTPFAARLRVGWSVLQFGAIGGNVTAYAFVDTTSGPPTLGQQVWSSGGQTATTAWTNVTNINVASKLTGSRTYYLKIAASTIFGAAGTSTTVGFDNVALTWSATGCPPGAVVGLLGADTATTQTGTAVKFNGNASWAYHFTWNDPTDPSKGGSYPIVTAADDPTVFSSFSYYWGDGTANTTGTSTAVGVATHTFQSAGNFPVKLTLTYTNAAVVPSTKTTSVGYTVRVITAIPAAQLKYPDIFTEVAIGEPDFLDPATDYETSGGEVLQNVYESLIWYQQGTEDVVTLVPRLATSVPTVANGSISADGMNYTFTLRSGVTFHSGGLMTADDVVYSIQRVLAIHDPNGPSWILEQILTNYAAETVNTCAPGGTGPCTVGYWVDSYWSSRATVGPNIRAVIGPQSTWNTTTLTDNLAWAIGNSSVASVDTTHVVFHLTHPYPAFLQAMAFTEGSVVSKACVAAHGGIQWATHNDFLDGQGDCGTGPYKFRTWERNQVIIMDRFDGYWRTPAKIKEVHLAKANDVATREFMLRSGDADVALIERDHQFDVMNTDGTPLYPTLRIVKDRPTFTVLFFGYNQAINTAKTPDPWTPPANFFADVHIRKTFSYAFNYQNFIANVIYGGGKQLRSPIPEGMFGYNPNIPLFNFDLDKAAAELRLTPYWNSGFTITLYYNAGNTVREQGTFLLKAGLEALHTQKGAPGVITVTTRALDWPVYLAALRAKALPIFFLGWAPDYADPDDYVVPFLRTGGTFPGRIAYSNASLDAKIDAAGSELNANVRRGLYFNLTYDAVVYDVPYLWIYQATNFHVERTWMTGYYFNPMLSGLDFYPLAKG